MRNKKNHSKKISILMAVFITLLCLSVSLRYYKNIDNNYNTIEYVLLVFENTVKSYFAQPILTISDIAAVKLSDNELVDKLLVFLYSVAILIAPFFTLANVLAVSRNIRFKIKTYIFRFLFKKSNDNVLVFSYNRFVKVFLDNEIENNKKIIVITKQTVELEEKLHYIDNDVWIIDEPALDNSDKLDSKYFIKFIDSIKHIIFLNEDSIKNYTYLNDFYNNILNIKTNTRNKKMIHCFAEDYQTKKMISDFLYSITIKENESNRNEKEWNEEVFIEDYKVFDLSSLRAIEFFSKNNIITNADKEDIHNVIIGFGRLGHTFLDYILTGSVYNQNGNIRIDIIDNDINAKKNYVFNRIDDRYFTKVDDYHLTLPNSLENDRFKCDGKLDIFFHKLPIEDRLFYDKMIEINNESKFGIDNIYICTRQDSITINALNTIKKIGDKHKEFRSGDKRIYIRMETNTKLPIINDNQLLKALSTSVGSQVDKVPIITSESDILNLKTIEDEDNTNIAIAYNYIYDKLSNAINSIVEFSDDTKLFDINSFSQMKKCLNKTNNSEWEGARNKWRTKLFYDRQSTWFLVMHNIVKERLLDAQVKNDKHFQDNLKAELTECLNKSFKNEEQLREYIEERDQSKLFEFIKIEHRRWNYFTALGGFRYDKKKEKSEYTHDCLLSYNELVKRNVKTVLYDLIPLIYILIEI